ncbi:hypothetical protein D3C87_370710 [compost metagenome]
MDTFHSTINCPDCGTAISINAKELLMGHKFSCHNCQVSIGLSTDSTEVVEQTIQKIEQFKKGTAVKR